MTSVKQPPHAIDAEVAVLGAMLMDADAAVTVFGVLQPEDFYRHEHQTIARAIRTLHDQRKSHDMVAVSNVLRDRGELENAGGMVYVAELALETYSIAAVEDHAKIVRDRALRRQVIALCAGTADAAYTAGSDDLTGMLSDGLDRLLRARGVRAQKFAELLGATEAYLNLARERRRAGGMLGVPSGLPGLDKVLGGFCPKRVYGIAARPGFGKTALLNQIAFHAATHGTPGLIVSIEMGAEELIVRGLSAATKRNVGRIFHGYDEEVSAALSAARQMGDLPLWLDTQTNEVDAILAQIATMKHRHGIQWAAIDHVGLMDTRTRFQSRNDQIGHITGKLKQFAKRYDMPLLALFQLSRLSEKESRKPGLHDLRDSGNIEQDLDVALFLHVEAQHRDKPQRPVQIGVLKNRSGRVGWLDSAFEFDGTVQTFREITSDYEPAPPRTEVDL